MSKPSHLLALETLTFALEVAPDIVSEAKRIGFLRGLPHEKLLPLRDIMECEQVFKPRAVKLEEAGFKMVDKLEGTFDTIMLLPERQREQTLSDIARGFDLLGEGGMLVVALHNDWGAKRFEKHVIEAAGEVFTFSKYHSRVFWVTKKKSLKEDVVKEWRHVADLRREVEGKFWTKPGLFAWDHVDPGSAMLTAALPADIKGVVADLGAGWGFLSQHLLHTYHDITALDAYEADRDGVEACRRNLGNVKVQARAQSLWHDVAQGVQMRRYDFIVMNPPFHEGREPEPELGMKFIAAAAQGLKSHGQLWLVANRQLPYEALLEEVFGHIVMVKQEGSYKILAATLPKHEIFFQRGRRPRPPK